MLDSIVATVGIPGAVLLFLIGLYFVTRIPWWAAKACVPNFEAVEAVKRGAPQWRAQAVKWITTFPERLSISGFFAFLLWPVMVLLNLLLLAQVLEMFLPGGERVSVWRMGSYTLLSLLGGALYSISQTVFGVVAGEVKRKSLVVLFLILLLATIGIEMGLAGYRAITIIGGDPLAPTAADQMMSRGVLLTMVLAFFFPVAHSVLGFIAVPRFLLPLAGYLPRVVLGLLYWLWSWFCQFYFGFQGDVIRVPAAVGNLIDKTRTLLKRTENLEADVKAAEELNASLSQTGKPFSEVQAEVAALANRPSAERERWNTELKRRTAELPNVRTTEECDFMDGEVALYVSSLESRSHALIADARAIESRLTELPRNAQTWGEQHVELGRKLSALSALIDKENSECGGLLHEREDLVAILKPAGSSTPEFNDPLIKQLDDVRRDALGHPEPRVRTQAMKQYAMCLDLLNNRLKNQLEAAQAPLNALKGRVEKVVKASGNRQAPPPPPPAQDLARVKVTLQNAQRETVRVSGEVRAAARRLRDAIMRVRRRVASGRLPDAETAKKKGLLGRFFAWLGSLFSEVIDAIMRANQGPEQKPGSDQRR